LLAKIGTTAITALAEKSLGDFLEKEPDFYTVKGN
jgi:hypothetical protein